jgi:hypothetical protein
VGYLNRKQKITGVFWRVSTSANFWNKGCLTKYFNKNSNSLLSPALPPSGLTLIGFSVKQRWKATLTRDFQSLSSLWMFPDNINSSNAIALVFLRKQNMFLHGKISRRWRRAHYTKKNMIYNCQTVTLWFNVGISSKNNLLRWRFSCFLVYFSLFWIKVPPICKMRVHDHVKNACKRSLISFTLCNFIV